MRLMSLLTALALLLVAAPAMAEEGTALEKAADFTLSSLEGGNVSLSDDPCMKEMPKLNEMQAELGPRGLQVISITVDEAKDESKVRAITRRFKYTPVVLLDTETRVVDMFNKRKDMPWTMVIGTDGMIHHKKKGFTAGDEEKLREWVEALLPK
jgi:thiol-disulfide isomerase/thioredoxin